jgi:hypothetical protein
LYAATRLFVTDRGPQAVLYRSLYRGRVIFAQMGRLLEESDARIVTATVPGDAALMLVGDRLELLADIASGVERTEVRPWYRNRVVWITPPDVPYAVGLFWRDATGEFLGHYINLQDPMRRTPLGIDSRDHVLDIWIPYGREWQWKDEHELEYAVRHGMFTPTEAAQFRRNGEAAIAALPDLIPTGWESWQPDPTWSPVQLPSGWDVV